MENDDGFILSVDDGSKSVVTTIRSFAVSTEVISQLVNSLVALGWDRREVLEHMVEFSGNELDELGATRDCESCLERAYQDLEADGDRV